MIGMLMQVPRKRVIPKTVSGVYYGNNMVGYEPEIDKLYFAMRDGGDKIFFDLVWGDGEIACTLFYLDLNEGVLYREVIPDEFHSLIEVDKDKKILVLM